MLSQRADWFSGVGAVMARWGMPLLVAAYVLSSVPLIATKPSTFDEVHVFSFDEYNICRQADFLLHTRSLIAHPANAVFPNSCDPFPYGQFYLLLIAVPLLIVQTVVTVSERMVIDWAVLVLVLSGAVTLGMLYKTCRRLYAPAYGLLAVLLLMLTPDFRRWSLEIHPDLPQLALLTTSFYFTVRLYERSETLAGGYLRDLSLASIFAGAAMATKFNGLFLLPVIVFAYNRPFLRGLKASGVRRFLARNLQCGLVTAILFGATALVLSPCVVAHPQLLTKRFAQITDTTSGRLANLTSPASDVASPTASGPSRLQRTLSNLRYSNHTVVEDVLGYGVYPLCVLGLLLGLGRLLTRYATEIREARVLADLFNLGFLSYVLLLGYELVDGRLVPGYERYLLPALPTLLITGLRVPQALLRWKRLPAPLAVGLLAALLLVGQRDMWRRTHDEYLDRYRQREKGFFQVKYWVAEHIPRGSIIYTEAYILMPEEGYTIVRDYAVQSLPLMARSDYVITKTLQYQIYKDPSQWEIYKTARPQVVAAKQIYEQLESGALPNFKKLVQLSAGDRYAYDDMVAVYQNLSPPARQSSR